MSYKKSISRYKNGIRSDGEEAVDGGPGKVQVSMEIKGTEQLM